MKNLENLLEKKLSDDMGKIILRFTLGFLMLLHGYSKLVNGIDGIIMRLVNDGFPELLAYGVYVGEIIAPIMIIMGLFTRISSAIYAFTMFFAIYIAHSSDVFTINEKSGGSVIELQLLFMFGAIALMFLGAGKYSVDKK
ncbi:MAG: DoxX family protein [Aliarcobacter sp.]|nr:DoxX family protein [Aliarcobacter sp.]